MGGSPQHTIARTPPLGVIKPLAFLPQYLDPGGPLDTDSLDPYET